MLQEGFDKFLWRIRYFNIKSNEPLPHFRSTGDECLIDLIDSADLLSLKKEI